MTKINTKIEHYTNYKLLNFFQCFTRIPMDGQLSDGDRSNNGRFNSGESWLSTLSDPSSLSWKKVTFSK